MLFLKCASFHFHPRCVSLHARICEYRRRLRYCEIARPRRWDWDTTWRHPAARSDLTPLLYLSQNIQNHFEHYWTLHPVSTGEYCTLFRVEDLEDFIDHYWCSSSVQWRRKTTTRATRLTPDTDKLNTTDLQVTVLKSIKIKTGCSERATPGLEVESWIHQ